MWDGLCRDTVSHLIVMFTMVTMVAIFTMLSLFQINAHPLTEGTHKKTVYILTLPRGVGVFQACPNCLEHFFIDFLIIIICFYFVIISTIYGIRGVLCVIFLQFIVFSLGEKAFIVLKSGASILIRGESAPQVPTFHGAPPIWAMPRFSLFTHTPSERSMGLQMDFFSFSFSSFLFTPPTFCFC